MTEPIDVRFFPTEAISPALRASIIDVCIRAHDNEDFHRLFSFVPSGGRHFLAYHGETLVSHAVVTTRWLQVEGRPVMRTAFVDAVSTVPEHQGRGYGSAVMRHLGENIDDYAIGCLETDRIGFYRRLGWEVWQGPLAGRSDQGLIPTPDQKGVMVLRLANTPQLSFDEPLSVECQAERIW